MAKISEMTDEEFKKMLSEYYAPIEQRNKLTPHQILELAERLNKKVDIPFIDETGEQKLLVKVITKVDNFLYNNLPNEFYNFARSLDHGINDEEAKKIISSLAKIANQKIDIPWIPEAAEYVAFRFVIGVVVNAVRKNWDYEKARDMMTETNIPELHDDNVEALVL